MSPLTATGRLRTPEAHSIIQHAGSGSYTDYDQGRRSWVTTGDANSGESDDGVDSRAVHPTLSFQPRRHSPIGDVWLTTTAIDSHGAMVPRHSRL